MTIDEIPVKADKIDIIDKIHLLSAEEFNAVVSMVRLLRDEVLSQGGTSYRVYLKNNLPSLSIAAQSGRPATIDFTFVSQSRDSIEDPYVNTGEYGLCTIMIQNDKYPEYTPINAPTTITSGVSIRQDVSEYLTAGLNYVRIQVVGNLTNIQTEPLTYAINLTSMGVSAPNFQWWRKLESDFTIPMLISGNNAKDLYIIVTGEDYTESYKIDVGSNPWLDNAFTNYKINHPGKSGVYTIEYYLGNKEGTLFTQSTYLEVICVLPNDPGKYIAINNIIDKATNWIENRMFDYAIYDGNRYASYLEFSVMNDVTEVYSSVEDEITTDEKHTFVYSMEIETNELSDFEVIVNLKNEDNSILESIEIPVDNSLSFGATPGAVFYMNPRTRSNNQANYLKVTNTIDGSEYDVTWKGMNWGNDGWTIDEEGNRILRMLGGSGAVIDYKPFYVRTGYEQDIARTGKTIEIDFLVKNITDYSKTVSDMSKQQTIAGQETFIGLKIMPEQVIMLSTVTKGLSYDQQGNVKSDNQQQIHICEDRRTRLTLTIVPNAYGNLEFNLCVIYIDGVKNREFVYPTNDIFGHDSPITIGSDYADVDIYGIRVYNQGLSSGAVLLNYINWLSTSDEKNKAADRADVFAEDGSTVSFEKVVNLTNEADTSKFNCFVIDSDVPSIDNKSDDIVCTLEVFFAEHPDWNFVTKNAPVGGQGTSSKYYRKWNLRWKLSKNSETTYADGRPSDTGKQLKFTNDPTKPVLSSRLTAKKNFASSMHSHKMGSVAAFNDLYHQVGLTNWIDSRIAVYQYPFIGFQKVINEEGKTIYNFIGLYTMGPDKGDDFCFGYDTDAYPNLLSIEGSDNDPLFALFRVPWNPNNPYMKYNPGENEEAYQYNGENSWDYDAGDPASDEVEKVADVEALYKLQWMPAYNFAYSCSDRIKPFEGTAEELNANKDTYKNEPYEFWVTGGDVYYWEKAEQMYIPSDVGNGTINLYNQLVDKGYGLASSDVEGKTAEELNELFKKARIQKFRQEMEYYFNLKDAIFHRNWVEFNAATDNRAKNTYPYIFNVLDTTTKEGNKWCWRGDDMDTIWPITNQGQSRKSYSVETHDSYDNGGPVWNGATSVFWNLVDAAFPEEINQEMIKFMKAMETLGGLTSESTYYDRIYAFFDKYYFQQAQEYFSMSLYNADAKWTYEDAKWAYMNGKYQNDTDPITQSLGDHYSAERRWLRKRIIYMMSKYSYGLFSASGDDHISVRSAGKGAELVFDLVPAIDLYPAISTGTSIKRGERTRAGEVRTMSFISEAADQQYKIHGAHYMLDIGDWFNKLTGGEMAVTGRMIRELRIGNEDASKVKISINKLNIQKCDSLQKLDVRNVTTMSSELDLSSCTHLREVYAKGTGLSQIILPNGGGLQYIQFGDFTEYLTLRNFPLLNADGVDISGCIDDIIHFNIQQCPNLNPLDLLMDVMEALEVQGDDHKLKYIRATGFDVTYDTSEVLDKITLLLDGTYFGLDSDGNSGSSPIPVLQGTININSYAYEDTVTELEEVYGKENLKINALGYAVRFLDPEVLTLLCEDQLWNLDAGSLLYIDSDRDGYITMEEILSITGFKTNSYTDRWPTRNQWGNSDKAERITRFNELKYFTGLLDDAATSDGGKICPCFSGGINLVEISYPKIENGIIRSADLNATNILKLILPEGFTTIQGSAIETGWLLFIDLPSTITTLGTGNPFRYIWEFTLVMRAEIPPTLSSWNGCNPYVIYVPDTSVDLYKAATTWSTYASCIKPLSEKTYAIYGHTIITQEGGYFVADFGCDYPYEKGVIWTIEEGGEYATISEDGFVKPKEGVYCKDVIIRGTSKLDNSVSYTCKCTVYDCSTFVDYKRLHWNYGAYVNLNTGEISTTSAGLHNIFNEYIEVKAGETICMQQHASLMSLKRMHGGVLCYDENYNYISYLGSDQYRAVTVKTIPSNAKYIRFTFQLGFVTALYAIYYLNTDEYLFKTPNFDITDV